MLLRGFIINTEVKSNLFPIIKIKNNKNIIDSAERTDNYLNIDFDNLGLGNIIKRFNITSDRFFNKIPLGNFQYINKEVNLDLLYDSFTMNGFLIVDREEFYLTQSQNKEIIEENNKKIDKIYNENKDICPKNSKDDKVTVKEYFSDNLYNMFVDFCDEKDVIYLDEITDELLEQFKNVKYIGNRKVEIVKEKLNAYESNNEFSKEIKITDNVTVKDCFSSDMFIKFCRKNNIKYVDEITEELFEEFRKVKFAGESRVKKIENKWYNCKFKGIKLNESLNGTLAIKDLFHEYKFNVFKDFCDQKKVIYLEDLSEDIFRSFIKTKGIGTQKIKDVKNKLNQIEKSNFKKIKIESLLTKNFIIKDLFYEDTFDKFTNFCEEKEIYFIEDLTNDDIISFGEIKWVGEAQVNNVKNRLMVIKNDIKNMSQFKFKYDLNNFDIHEFTINEVLEFLNIDSEINSDMTIEELYNKDIRYLKNSEKEKKTIFHLFNILQKVEEPNEIIRKFLNQLKKEKKDYEIFIDRYRKKLTLQETGETVDLTRERVRQIAKKIINSFELYLANNYFKESLLLSFLTYYYYKKNIFSYEDLSHFLEKDYTFVLDILKDEIEFFYYEDTYKLFFLNQAEKTSFRLKTNNIMDELPDVFLVEEVDNYLQFDSFENDLLSSHQFLKNNSYKKYGNIYANRSLSIKDFVKFVFKRDLPKEVKMNDGNYKKIINTLKYKYNYNLTSPKRSVIGATRAAEEFVLSGKNTFQLFNIEDYDMELLEEIIDYCGEELEKRNQINIEVIFDKFKKQLKNRKIENKTHLYSVLKKVYSDRYDFGKGNTLNIYRNKEIKVDEIDLLISFMKDNDGIRTKKEIIKQFNWTDQKIMLKIYSSDKFVLWGRNTYRLIEDWATESQVEKVNQIIKSHFKEQGFITENQLYEEALFSMDLNQLIRNKKIDSSSKFRNTFRPYIEDLKGVSIVIIPKHSDNKNIEDIILEKFSNGVTRKKLANYLRDELKYNANTAESIISKLLSKNKIFELNLGYLYPTEKLDISQDVIQKLQNYIKNERNEEPYIILKNIVGYRTRLPEIEIEWTPYLIKYLLLKTDYKELEIFNNDYRMDQLILLNKNSSMNTIDELIYYVLNEKYTGNWHEAYVVVFLEEEGFLYKKRASRKKLPVSLYKKSLLINVNELGIVELVGD